MRSESEEDSRLSSFHVSTRQPTPPPPVSQLRRLLVAGEHEDLALVSLRRAPLPDVLLFSPFPSLPEERLDLMALAARVTVERSTTCLSGGFPGEQIDAFWALMQDLHHEKRSTSCGSDSSTADELAFGIELKCSTIRFGSPPVMLHVGAMQLIGGTRTEPPAPSNTNNHHHDDNNNIMSPANESNDRVGSSPSEHPSLSPLDSARRLREVDTAAAAEAHSLLLPPLHHHRRSLSPPASQPGRMRRSKSHTENAEYALLSRSVCCPTTHLARQIAASQVLQLLAPQYARQISLEDDLERVVYLSPIDTRDNIFELNGHTLMEQAMELLSAAWDLIKGNPNAIDVQRYVHPSANWTAYAEDNKELTMDFEALFHRKTECAAEFDKSVKCRWHLSTCATPMSTTPSSSAPGSRSASNEGKERSPSAEATAAAAAAGEDVAPSTALISVTNNDDRERNRSTENNYRSSSSKKSSVVATYAPAKIPDEDQYYGFRFVVVHLQDDGVTAEHISIARSEYHGEPVTRVVYRGLIAAARKLKVETLMRDLFQEFAVSLCPPYSTVLHETMKFYFDAFFGVHHNAKSRRGSPSVLSSVVDSGPSPARECTRALAPGCWRYELRLEREQCGGYVALAEPSFSSAASATAAAASVSGFSHVVDRPSSPAAQGIPLFTRECRGVAQQQQLRATLVQLYGAQCFSFVKAVLSAFCASYLSREGGPPLSVTPRHKIFVEYRMRERVFPVAGPDFFWAVGGGSRGFGGPLTEEGEGESQEATGSRETSTIRTRREETAPGEGSDDGGIVLAPPANSPSTTTTTTTRGASVPSLPPLAESGQVALDVDIQTSPPEAQPSSSSAAAAAAAAVVVVHNNNNNHHHHHHTDEDDEEDDDDDDHEGDWHLPPPPAPASRDNKTPPPPSTSEGEAASSSNSTNHHHHSRLPQIPNPTTISSSSQFSPERFGSGSHHPNPHHAVLSAASSPPLPGTGGSLVPKDRLMMGFTSHSPVLEAEGETSGFTNGHSELGAPPHEVNVLVLDRSQSASGAVIGGPQRSGKSHSVATSIYSDGGDSIGGSYMTDEMMQQVFGMTEMECEVIRRLVTRNARKRLAGWTPRRVITPNAALLFSPRTLPHSPSGTSGSPVPGLNVRLGLLADGSFAVVKTLSVPNLPMALQGIAAQLLPPAQHDVAPISSGGACGVIRRLHQQAKAQAREWIDPPSERSEEVVHQLLSLWAPELEQMRHFDAKNVCPFIGLWYDPRSREVCSFHQYIGGDTLEAFLRESLGGEATARGSSAPSSSTAGDPSDPTLMHPLLSQRAFPSEPVVPCTIVRAWTQQLLAGLQYLHNRDIPHGTLCPSHLLLDASADAYTAGQVKLIHYGAAEQLFAALWFGESAGGANPSRGGGHAGAADVSSSSWTNRSGVGSRGRAGRSGLRKPKAAKRPAPHATTLEEEEEENDEPQEKNTNRNNNNNNTFFSLLSLDTLPYAAPEICRLASLRESAAFNETNLHHHHRESGGVDLTTMTMTIEQRCRADVWSVGCLVAEMITGCPPWRMLPGPGSSGDKNSKETATSAGVHLAELSHALRKIIAAGNMIPNRLPDEELATPGCVDFIHCCLNLDPEARPEVRHLLHHPWITGKCV